jgi:hypothetical protein
MSAFVADQRGHAFEGRLSELVIPSPHVDIPKAHETSVRVGLSAGRPEGDAADGR